MYSFDDLIERLDGYEKEMEKLWESYDPNDSQLKIEVTALKLSTPFYQYSIDVFEYIEDGFFDLLFKKLRMGLTLLSYVLSASTIVVSPQITPAAILSSLYLHFKNKNDNKKMIKMVNKEQGEILFDKMDKIEDIYIDKSDAIYDRTIDFESMEYIESFEEPEKTERIICNKLLNSIKNNGKFKADNKEQEIIVRGLINSTFNIDEEDYDKLIKLAKKEYNKLVNEIHK